eukprot:scaffold287_cov337-Pavlova_lutheri.AAC.212
MEREGLKGRRVEGKGKERRTSPSRVMERRLDDIREAEGAARRRTAGLHKHLVPNDGLKAQGCAIIGTATANPRLGIHVAVLGASGGIGQPLSLLLARRGSELASLRLYDVANVAGVAADLSHVDARAPVRAYLGPSELADALHGVDLVVLVAGAARKPGMSRDDLFQINAKVVYALATAAAQHAPKAWLLVVTNPVDATVPIALEAMRRKGAGDDRKVIGVTSLDAVRARKFVGDAVGIDPARIKVPVVGGHAANTMLPLLSQCSPRFAFTEQEVEDITTKLREAGTQVVEAKAGGGSATLSMAHAADRFVGQCLRAMQGVKGIVECAYVSSSITELPYFASPVVLGRDGVEAYLPLGPLNAGEREALQLIKPDLLRSIQKGTEFARNAQE